MWPPLDSDVFIYNNVSACTFSAVTEADMLESKSQSLKLRVEATLEIYLPISEPPTHL